MPTLTQADLTRAAGLYFPVVLALALGLYRRIKPLPRLFPATLLATLWCLPSLLLLQQFNLRAHWWSYEPGSVASLLGMPLELYLGWAVLWGVLPAFAVVPALDKVFTKLSLPLAVVFLIGVDLVLMPVGGAAVTLGPRWLLGELVAVLLVLLPALFLARATQRGTYLTWRAGLQLVLAAGLFLYWMPELTAAISHTALRPKASYPWLLAFAVVLALPGLGGILEFVQRGGGTPIPYDPPVRLVTSGIYRYVANPLQLSCTLVMLVWPWLLHNWLLVIPALLSAVYSVGLATWDEGEDLRVRFGEPWVDYRRHVRNWLPRLAPYHSGAPARLYYAHRCGVCSELGQWVSAQAPVGLELLSAESLAQLPNRLLYVSASGEEASGTRAFACALEHLNLGYALAGVLLRLPGTGHLVQLVMDASGFDEQTLCLAESKE